MTSTSDSTLINKTDFLDLFAQARHVDDFCGDNLDLLSEKVVSCHVEDERPGEGMDKQKLRKEKKSAGWPGYSEPAHDKVLCIIHETI